MTEKSFSTSKLEVVFQKCWTQACGMTVVAGIAKQSCHSFLLQLVFPWADGFMVLLWSTWYVRKPRECKWPCQKRMAVPRQWKVNKSVVYWYRRALLNTHGGPGSSLKLRTK